MAATLTMDGRKPYPSTVSPLKHYPLSFVEFGEKIELSENDNVYLSSFINLDLIFNLNKNKVLDMIKIFDA